MTETKYKAMESALKVIHTWASFDLDGHFEKTLIPKDVIKLCNKALGREE